MALSQTMCLEQLFVKENMELIRLLSITLDSFHGCQFGGEFSMDSSSPMFVLWLIAWVGKRL
jgi:hypothetical protein